MALFQQSVLNKHLNNIDEDKVATAFAKFQETYNLNKIEEINNLQSQITQTDKEIDQIVYKLYGLTDEEIMIVEGS